ncbi:hypothetical protein DL89DRAFT_264768 [Linderina pennispora]|uniref:Uncharacterized protein n=1 Tax=Linderina pennispora TaxID=61395 RepID=A0A1Y1WN39_9FUNG|nr:uncharacterized protein DL89DRAFT_264768 [Linderina pennispora]ORX74969.1 hypothetical protein DL89DRAFT_264768 [Linderina pennispora]
MELPDIECRSNIPIAISQLLPTTFDWSVPLVVSTARVFELPTELCNSLLQFKCHISYYCISTTGVASGRSLLLTLDMMPATSVVLPSKSISTELRIKFGHFTYAL